VLIVEDEVLLALDVELMVEDAGLEPVGHAVRGTEAIEMVDRLRPEVLLVCVQLLDGTTGLAVAAHATRDRNTLVILMTGNRQILPADLVGAWGVIPKPYSHGGFVQALRFVRAYLNGDPISGGVPSSIELGSNYRDEYRQRTPLRSANGEQPPPYPGWSHGR
jgi:CheY-like chemotaxis protein